MTAKCQYCGKSFPTVKQRNMHEAKCPLKDPSIRLENEQRKIAEGRY